MQRISITIGDELSRKTRVAENNLIAAKNIEFVKCIYLIPDQFKDAK